MRTRQTIRTLNRLIRTCRDGEEMCAVCGDAVHSAGLRSLLRYRSEEWGRQGDELQALVLLLGGEPATSASFSARLGVLWLSIKTAMLGQSDLVGIEMWQRIQQRGLDRYENALQGYLPERIRRTVALQAGRVLDRSEKLSLLRGEYAMQSPGVCAL